jgi:2-oxoglutarate dehydrogenase E1 component
MGAWSYVEPRIRAILPAGSALAYAGRPERASPAEGYPAAHAAEQTRIIASALERSPARRNPVTMPVAGEAKG